jgi:hypothetical protein
MLMLDMTFCIMREGIALWLSKALSFTGHTAVNPMSLLLPLVSCDICHTASLPSAVRKKTQIGFLTPCGWLEDSDIADGSLDEMRVFVGSWVGSRTYL